MGAASVGEDFNTLYMCLISFYFQPYVIFLQTLLLIVEGSQYLRIEYY